jgi:hypothetical protein
LAIGVPAGALGGRLLAADDNDLEVWKSLTCGCCTAWVTHMRTNGFRPTVHDVADVTPCKRRAGVPASLESCHTALVGGYAVAGHVPADLVRRMLKERPAIVGLAVPGMPMGSPGMEGPRKDPYDDLTFAKNGRTSVYAKR